MNPRESFKSFQSTRLIVVGAEVNCDFPMTKSSCQTHNDVMENVRTYSKFFIDDLKVDIQVLSKFAGRDSRMTAFQHLLRTLRTPDVHGNLTPDTLQAATDWQERNGTPSSQSDAISRNFEFAMEELCETAFRVLNDRKKAQYWRDMVTADVSGIFEATAHDLHKLFKRGNKARMIRNVENRLRVSHRKVEVSQDDIKDYCVQEILQQRDPLPVPYIDILDRLNLINHPLASGALLIAYGVSAQNPGLTGTKFIDRVVETLSIAMNGTNRLR